MIAEPIVILAPGRSGSSLTAALFHALGAWAGNCRKADEWNPGGYFENGELNRLRRQKIFTRETVTRVLRSQGYQGGPWLTKHSAGHWAGYGQFKPYWVCVHRDPAAIIASRQRRGRPQDMTQIALLPHQIEAMREVCRTYPGRAWNVEPARFMAGDFSALREPAEAAGLAFDESMLRPVVHPEWWHG